MRILIVEDDKDLRGYLRTGLKAEGFSIDEAADAEKAVQLATENTYDIILCDINLPPGQSGIWAVRTLRHARNNAYIIMITGRSGEEDSSDAYEGGAEDYILKPLRLSDLVYKIRAWLNRRQGFLASDVSSTILVVGDLRLDLMKRRAVRGEKIIPLTSKEFAILEYLMRHKGRIKSQTAILNQTSNVDFDGMSNSVEFHIKNLREKIDKDFPNKLIRTIRGSGYMIDDEMES